MIQTLISILFIQLMLSFTHNEHSRTGGLDKLDFQPLVISNKPQGQGPFPRQPQKKIIKTFNRSKSRDRVNQKSRQGIYRQKQNSAHNISHGQGWAANGKIQIFDRNLRKNELAQEQRRMRAEQRRQKNEAVRQITKNEKNIRGKTLKLENQQQKQIQELKLRIEKQRAAKVKNQQQFQAQKKELQKQRADLMKLQRKIHEHGVRHQKQYTKELVVLNKNEYPTNDRAKCHQDMRTHKAQGKQFQVSQSEANHQRQALRQKQLELLTQQRQRCMQNTVTMSYNPTIVPLLSRASYKIISTHVSTLVELLVDDILEEQVYLLQEIELEQKLQQQKARQKNMIQDYYNSLDEFVDEVQTIQNKLGRYHTMKFQDLYMPKNSFPQHEPKHYKTDFATTCQLAGIDSEVVDIIQERRDRFIRYVSNFDDYKKGHLNMFDSVTEELIDDMIAKMAHELDKGSNDFVDLIFRKEFE